MSARLRQFSVLPAALANISGDETTASSSRPDHGSPLVAALGARPAGRDHRCTIRNRRRPWIVAAGQVPATVPMWNSRSSWLAQLEVWRNLNREMLRKHHMSERLFRRIMAALARYADGATGRHCAVSNKTIAQAVGCDRRSVSTARAILAASGYGIEVRRGSGSPGKPSHWCRNSVWHLISRRPSPVETGFCALPTLRTLPSKTPVGSHSPSEARTASPTDSLQKRRRRTTASAPRDLHTQRIAGWLASTGIGMEARRGRHVVGQLCAALEASHLQLDAWSGPTLIQALNADMTKRGLNWPDRIDQPGAFLATRLRHLPARPELDTTPAPPAIVAEPPRGPITLTEVGRAAKDHVRACIAAARRR